MLDAEITVCDDLPMRAARTRASKQPILFGEAKSLSKSGLIATRLIHGGASGGAPARPFAYTSTGLKWSFTDENGNQYQTYYDGAARPVKTISPSVSTALRGGPPEPAITITTYDANSNVVQFQDPNNDLWNYQYDPRNRKT